MARVKGTQIADLARALRDMREQIGPVPEHLETYLEEKVLFSSWYPETDFRDLMLIIGRTLRPQIEGNVWRYLGKLGAKRDVAGVYASWVREGDPERTLQRLATGWTTVRDSGRLSVTMLAPKEADLIVRGYAVMCSELAETNAGYLAEMLEASGAVEVDAKVIELIDAGARWKITWK